MPTWVTHLMIADGVLRRFPNLDRRGFCVGSIAPDCNVENEDWTAYTPPRAVTHWMQGEKKAMSDCGAFLEEYFLRRRETIKTAEQRSFLLGYYAHLITDAGYQAFTYDKERVRAAWRRIQTNDSLRQRSSGMAESWASIKNLVTKDGIFREIYGLEAEYLDSHPDSGYFTEILPLKEFPDYIDYLPHGCIVRKIGVMGYLPDRYDGEFLTISRDEFLSFVDSMVELTVNHIKQFI